LELVAYVGSAEAVRAAVVNGADAVRLGIRGFSPFASSFAADGDDVAAAAEYCRIRGVKVYLSVSLPPGDGGFKEALCLVLQACRRGADAVCSGDLGLLRALRQLLPETPLHADVSLAYTIPPGVVSCLHGRIEAPASPSAFKRASRAP
jgi:putative protease